MKWYLVGGALRDMTLGLQPHETDWAFSGTPENMLKICPDARLVGRSVHVYMLHGSECMPLVGDNVHSDLLARDLTINALAMDEDGVLHAHPQALSDLSEGILRPASPTALADDPTRVYRLARFAASFPHFTVHEEALSQAKAVIKSGAHRSLPAERVGRELQKALNCPSPSRFLQVLAQCGGFNHWFKELENADTVPAGPLPWHEGSVLAHTTDIMDKVAGDPLRAWMALCHDLGKVSTPKDILPHHYRHEERGCAAARTLGQRLALPAHWINAGALTAQEHMKGGIYQSLRMGTRRDLIHIVHTQHLDAPFWAVVDADSGRDMSSVAQEHLQVLLHVTLPEHKRGLGAESGKHLRLLQCTALAEHVSKANTPQS